MIILHIFKWYPQTTRISGIWIYEKSLELDHLMLETEWMCMKPTWHYRACEIGFFRNIALNKLDSSEVQQFSSYISDMVENYSLKK